MKETRRLGRGVREKSNNGRVVDFFSWYVVGALGIGEAQDYGGWVE